MTRASVYIVVFLVAFNAGAGLLMMTPAGGGESISETIGLGADEIDQDATEDIDDAVGAPDGEEDGEVNVGSGSGSILGLELFVTLGSALSSVFTIQPGMNMLVQAGVPQYIIGWANSIMALVVAIDLLNFVRGGGL